MTEKNPNNMTARKEAEGKAWLNNWKSIELKIIAYLQEKEKAEKEEVGFLYHRARAEENFANLKELCYKQILLFASMRKEIRESLISGKATKHAVGGRVEFRREIPGDTSSELIIKVVAYHMAKGEICSVEELFVDAQKEAVKRIKQATANYRSQTIGYAEAVRQSPHGMGGVPSRKQNMFLLPPFYPDVCND